VFGLQALATGLVHGLVVADHPLATLEWTAARRSFYAAAADGIDADLTWVDADGARTTDSERIFEELFEYARRGLADAGLSGPRIDSYLGPLEERVAARTTPSTWKKKRVRDRLADGHSLPEAVVATGREYLERSRETDTFAEWL